MRSDTRERPGRALQDRWNYGGGVRYMRHIAAVEGPDKPQESQIPHAKDHFYVASSAVLVGNGFLTKKYDP